MKIAAVDIGSNAVRFIVNKVIDGAEGPRFKQVAYLRFPLKLGQDVFRTQSIELESQSKLFQLLRVFKMLKELYGVDHWRICATAAFREATNKQEVLTYLHRTLGLNIEVIDGHQEAALIAQALEKVLAQKKYFFHADVGGGSTELSFYVRGVLIDSQSFKLGAVRMLEEPHQPHVWSCVRHWIQRQRTVLKRPPYGIATGGGIRKIAHMAGCHSKELLTIKRLQQIAQKLYQENETSRAAGGSLPPDVIVPAAQIYSSVMEWAGVTQMFVPNVGLKEGIVRTLYKSMREKNTLSNHR